MKYAAYEKAKETNPAVAPWQFDLEAEDQWKCAGTPGALFPMEMDTDCVMYQAYAQAKETNPALTLWQYDLDPKDEWKCKAFASAGHLRGASPYYGFDSDCWKYKMWQDAKEKNPNANMFMYGLDFEDQYKCQYMNQNTQGTATHQGPVSYNMMMEEDCAKVAAYLRAKQTNPNAQPWQFDVDIEEIAKCQAVGVRGKRQFGADDAFKYQQLQNLEKTGVLSDDMFDEDYLRWKAMLGAGVSNAGVNPMLYDEDAWKYGAMSGSAPASPMWFDEDAYKYQNLANLKSQGITTKEMFDEDFLRYEQWKNAHAKDPLFLKRAQMGPYFGEDAYKYEQLLNMKNQGAQMGPELAKKLLDEDFLRYEAWKKSQTNSQAPVNPMAFHEDYWKYAAPTGGMAPGSALFGEDFMKYEQLSNLKNQPGAMYNSELAKKMLDEDFLRYEQWKKSQTATSRPVFRGQSQAYVNDDILKFQQLEQMEKQGMMNDELLSEDYLRWKATKQNAGSTGSPAALDEDAWKYNHPGYGLFGEEAWKYDQMLKMKEAGQLTDKMLDEDFLRYEQWKHTQETTQKPTITPGFGGHSGYHGFVPQTAQPLFDPEFMQKLEVWKALHGGRAQYSPYMYQMPYYNMYSQWPSQYYQPQAPVVNPAYSAPSLSKDQMTAGLNKVLNNQIDVFAEDKKCGNANVKLQVDASVMRGSAKVDSRCSSYYTVTKDGAMSCVPAGESCDLVEDVGSVVFYIPGATVAELDQAISEAENLVPKRSESFSPLTGETQNA